MFTISYSFYYLDIEENPTETHYNKTVFEETQTQGISHVPTMVLFEHVIESLKKTPLSYFLEVTGPPC